VTVTWSPVDGATYYKIYWDTVSGVSESSNVVVTNSFPFIHADLIETTTYYYRISAGNPIGESALSAEVHARAKTPFNEMVEKLKAKSAAAGNYFGCSVAVSGDYMIVGAYGDDQVAGNAGAAYIFHRTGPDSWDPGVKLTAADGASGDFFGYSVSIYGDYAVVSSHFDDDGASNTGSAYIYHRTGVNTWDGGTKIHATDHQAGDAFGCSVSIGKDYVVVGAHYEDGGAGNPAVDSGAAYIFHRTDTNTWDAGTKIVPPHASAGSYFGRSVSISGTYAVVGEPWNGTVSNSAGSAYVFHRTGDNEWSEGVELVQPDSNAYGLFGISVSISGDYAVVSAQGNDGGDGEPLINSGAAYVFHRTGTNEWDDVETIRAPDAQTNDNFGSSVSIYGSSLIVGAMYESGGPGDPVTNSGSAYIFRMTGTNTWDKGMRISAPDSANLNEFGNSVSIWEDTAVVGSWQDDDDGVDSGAAYVF
jgi:hypothetical protein